MPHEIGKTYWHVGNSGVTFKVIDEGFGPTFVIESGAFGNLDNTQKYFTDKPSLVALRDVLNEAIAYDDYSKEYVEPASVLKAKVIDSVMKEAAIKPIDDYLDRFSAEYARKHGVIKQNKKKIVVEDLS
jgi:hypothetical protein